MQGRLAYDVGTMFKLLKSIFNSQPAALSFYRFYRKLEDWKNAKRYPYTYELPEAISLSPKVHSEFIRLFKLTRSDGKERAITLWLVDREVIVSSVTKGSSKSVTPKSSIQVKYDKTHKPEYFDRKVYVDGKLYSKRRMHYKKIPKKVDIKYLFNMHTHPPHTDPTTGKTYYSFFSLQDIKSLISSQAIVSGMIGDKIWLLVRTSRTPSIAHECDEHKFNSQVLFEQYGLVTYTGDFKQKLRKIGLQQGNS